MTRLLPQTRLQWALLSGACLAAAVLRLPGLGAELNHDEAFTWLAFASQPYAHIATDYSLPNNHVFHTLLVRLSSQIFGSAEWALRLPAFIGGCLAVPSFYLLGHAFADRVSTGLVAAWLLALLPVHINYAQMARGYTLLVLGSALTLLALHQFLQGRGRLWWGLFVPCAFLAGYTVPSGGLHLLALGVWTLIALRRDRRRLYEALAAHALVGALLIVGYWPLRHALPVAAAKWGIAVDGDPTILIRFIGDIARLLGGNPWPLPVILVALLGFGRFVYSRHLAAPFIAVAWILPFVAALAIGTAGQPRTYLFLLPSFVLCLALAVEGRYRLIPVLALLLLWIAAYRLPATAETGYAAIADYLRQHDAPSRVVIAPFIMGIPLWHYAQEPITDGLVRALNTHRIDELLVATHTTDSRFGLGRYLTSGNINYDSRYIEFAGDSFAHTHQAGHIVLNRLSSPGRLVFPHSLVQEWKQTNTAVALGAGPRAFSHWPSMKLTQPQAAPFALHSGERFSAPDSGLVVLSYALSDPDTRITLYVVDGGKVVPMEMSRTVETTTRSDPGGRTWFLESHFTSVRPEAYYGVYIRGSASGEQYLSDLFCTFFNY